MLLSPLLIKLRTLGAVGDEERQAMEVLTLQEKSLAPGEIIINELDEPKDSVVVLSGLVFRFKITNESRQILSLHPAGDMPDVQSLFLYRMDHGLAAAASPTRIAMIPHTDLLSLFKQFPRLERLFWRETLTDAAIYREAIANLGSRVAPERLAHLFCEHFTRMKSRKLVSGNSCKLPLTQQHLADVLGLSLVHVNRSLMALRKLKLADLKDGTLEVSDFEGLKAFCDFRDAYLHII